MSRLKLWGLVVAAVVLPLALVMSALAISSGIEASPVVPGLDPASTESPDDRSGRGSGSDDRPTPSPSRSTVDVSGPCDEAEHADDPECLTGSGDSSGSGSDDSGSGSGSGSDDSGPSDSSGSSGSGGSGSNSGPGGGDD